MNMMTYGKVTQEDIDAQMKEVYERQTVALHSHIDMLHAQVGWATSILELIEKDMLRRHQHEKKLYAVK